MLLILLMFYYVSRNCAIPSRVRISYFSRIQCIHAHSTISPCNDSCIPVPCGRYTTKLRSCNTRATILDGIWIKKKEKKREISAPTNFFPRKERKMFRAFSKSGASLNHSNYILRERRKSNGVIFIFSKEKKKKHCHTRLTDVRMRLALISIHCVNQVFLPGYFHGGGGKFKLHAKLITR